MHSTDRMPLGTASSGVLMLGQWCGKTGQPAAARRRRLPSPASPTTAVSPVRRATRRATAAAMTSRRHPASAPPFSACSHIFPHRPVEIEVNHRSSNPALEHALQSDSASPARRCSLCSSVCPSSPTSRSTAAGASARQSAPRLWRVWWWRCLKAKSPAAPPRPPSTRPSPPWLQREGVGCNG